MILTGEELTDLCFPVLGKDWKTELARRMGVSRQTIHAKSKSKTGHPKSFKCQVLAVLEDQLLVTAKRVDRLRQDIGAL